MTVNDILSDENAASLVIGIVLMIAIIEILTTIIASFVPGLGSTTSAAPRASFASEQDDGGDGTSGSDDGVDPVTVTHNGGDAVNQQEAAAMVDGTETTAPSRSDSETTAGDSLTVHDADVSIRTDDWVRAVWRSSGDDESATLSSSTVP